MIVVDKSTDISKVDFEAGAVILINKPLHWTSFDVVNKIRFALRKRYDKKKFKVGHNGTLDPLATGLLMIFTGKATKTIPMNMDHDKRYIGIVKLGVTTASLDRELEEIDFAAIDHITEDFVINTAGKMVGKMEQEIPFYSATKVGGVPMYKLARKEKEIEKKYKSVVFHEIKVLDFKLPYVEVDILCGKGTYIRAFARDLGTRMNTTAYLYALKRTEIDQYKVLNAMDVKDVCIQINELE